MAVIQYRGALSPLNNSTRFTAVLPDIVPDGKWRVLWLLNDEGRLSDDLLRRLDIEKISINNDLAVIMPEGLHSDYENMVRGLRWYDYISEGLPSYIREIFPVSNVEKDNFVFGFGMGAIGAFRLALRDPDFAAAFGCCGADFDLFSDDYVHSDPEFIHRMNSIYGDNYRTGDALESSCPWRMAERAEKIPHMFIAGDDSAQKMADVLNKKGGKVSCLVTDDVSPSGPALNEFLRMISPQK